MLKTCRVCQQELPTAKFPKKGRRCYSCIWKKDRLTIDKSKVLERTLRHQKQKRTEVNLFKESHPCTDCGIYYPHYILQFDHVRGIKLFDIGHSVESQSRPKIWAEIDKCEIVCANCHSARTYLRKK